MDQIGPKMASWLSQPTLLVKIGWIWLDGHWICLDEIRTDHFVPFAAINKVKIGAQWGPKVAHIRP